MAQRSRRGGRRSKKKGDSDFVRLTGLWRPSNSSSKAMGTGNFTLDTLEDLQDKIKEKGADKVVVFLLKNEYAESKRDPRYVLSALPVVDDEEDEDDDNRGRRRRRKSSSKPKSRSRRRDEDDEDEEEEDDDLDDDDDDEEEPPF